MNRSSIRDLSSASHCKDKLKLTECLQECRTRLATAGIELDTPGQRFDHAPLAVIRPAQGVELLWVQHSTADGQAAALEG